jgi:hypothetical protein
LDTIPGLREKHPKFNKNTVARLMKPPRRKTKAAERYKGLIDARPFRIENDKHKYGDRVCEFK